ncbi:SGNH/GDSL hydrolase family protein [bacterium]|nr:SGNH/GDSL hydrolase family protein [bacterium]
MALVRYWRRKYAFRLAALLVSVVLTFAIIEIALRLLGMMYDSRIYRAAQAPTDATHFVLAVGDSHTYGVGAKSGLDYPSQLQALLNDQRPCDRYRVVNLGHAGYNSSQTVNDAQAYMDENRSPPEIVIFNAGRNNDHNFTDARIIPEEHRFRGVRGVLRHLLSESRAHRFGQITVSRLKSLLETKLDGDQWPNMTINGFGEHEQAFLAEWVGQDLGLLRRRCARAGAKLVLLNYYSASAAWVNDAFRRFSTTPETAVVDVRGFGRPKIETLVYLKKYVARDGHPNAEGYAAIARMVHDELARRGWIAPASCETPLTPPSPASAP